MSKMNPGNYNEFVVNGTTPGSDKAITLGCVCPRMDNNRGAGVAGLFWINADCPLHGTSASPRAIPA